MGKFQYVNELSKTLMDKNRRVNIKNDDAYIQSLLKTQIDDVVANYLKATGEDDTGKKKLRIEVRKEYSDHLMDFMENNSVSETLIFRQISPTIYEIEQRDLGLFN